MSTSSSTSSETVDIRCSPHLLAATGVALALGVLMGSAVAQTTTTTTFQVSSGVARQCSISATTLAFGIYTGVQLDATSIISVACTNTTPYDVGLDGGLGGNTNGRKMLDVTRTKGLKYSLFSDAARTQAWGNRIGTDTVSGIGNGVTQPLTVYGRVDRNQNLPFGDYLDVITATISF